MKNINRERTLRRKKRVSSIIKGTAKKPRLSVFRSNRYIYVQAINDERKITLASFSSLNLEKTDKKKTKVEEAKLTGQAMAKLLIKKGILTAVFDRGRYSYLGRVKALAEGMRAGGIKI
ncbi:MAG: 50S ribosomal protein L18 [Microgenomates group bacterium]|nr:50S ribosomal protein L18 [Microgenomates group bacterium]